MKKNFLSERRFLALLFARAPHPWSVIKSIKYMNTTNGRFFFLVKQIQGYELQISFTLR